MKIKDYPRLLVMKYKAYSEKMKEKLNINDYEMEQCALIAIRYPMTIKDVIFIYNRCNKSYDVTERAIEIIIRYNFSLSEGVAVAKSEKINPSNYQTLHRALDRFCKEIDCCPHDAMCPVCIYKKAILGKEA